MEKVKCILLIDDNEDTNFINEVKLMSEGVTDKVISKTSVYDAIDYLKQADKEDSFPDLIFIDIRMPVDDGFEFVTEYEESGFVTKYQSRLFFLSTTMHQSDYSRAKSVTFIENILMKPLDEEKIRAIMS